ncbi:MAG: hypothetical protein CMJ31_09505 [Phycisphaerae bacterium]|nr:hypothetical protein [Phycisphaerae bacterium]
MRLRGDRMCRAVVVAAIVMMLAPAVWAAPVDLGMASGSRAGHAWLVVPLPPDRVGTDEAGDIVAILAHTAPRRPDAPGGSAYGAAQIFRRLTQIPSSVAAIDQTLYLLFPPTDDDESARIRTVSALPTGIAEYWRQEPLGRYGVIPSPDGLDDVTELSELNGELVASDGSSSFVLRDNVWVVINTDHADAGNEIEIDRDGGVCVVRRGDGVVCDFDAPPGASLVAATVPAAHQRLVIAWIAPRFDADPDARGIVGDPLELAMVEVSLDTGRIWHEGAVNAVAPVAAQELRYLATGLVILMAAAIAILLKPAPDAGLAHLPAGTCLAPLGQRGLAWLIDVSLVSILASFITGVPLSKLVGPEILIGSEPGWTLLPSIAFLGLVYGVASEATAGRTIGKLLAGCWVTRVGVPETGGSKEAAKAPNLVALSPGLSASFVRNAVKWVLPPVAMLIVFDLSGRHRGDVLSRLAVVTSLTEEDPTGNDEEGIGPDSG